MSRIKTLKGHCTHCGGLLLFPAESAGLTMDCPLCGQQTELLLARPPEDPTIPRKTIVWTIIAVLLLSGGLVGALAALKRAERWAASRNKRDAAATTMSVADTSTRAAEEPFARQGFRVSEVTLEKVPGSSLVYSTGTISNVSDRQRFGVRVELELLDANGQKIGMASDYQAVVEPKGQWRFKALVVNPKTTASARLSALTEQP